MVVVFSQKKLRTKNGEKYTRYNMQIENASGTKSKIFSVYRKE